MISTIQHSWLCHCGFRSRHRSSGCSLMPPIGHRKWFVTRLWNCQKESNSFSFSLNHTCTQKTDGGWKAVKRLLFSVYLHRFLAVITVTSAALCEWNALAVGLCTTSEDFLLCLPWQQQHKLSFYNLNSSSNAILFFKQTFIQSSSQREAWDWFPCVTLWK